MSKNAQKCFKKFLFFYNFTGIQFKMTGFVAERKGERDDMQDAHVIVNNLLSEADCEKPCEM